MRRVVPLLLVMAGFVGGQVVYGSGGPLVVSGGENATVPAGTVTTEPRHSPTSITTTTPGEDPFGTVDVPTSERVTVWQDSDPEDREYDPVNPLLVSRGVREHVDQMRRERGTALLEGDEALRTVAKRHSDNMALHGYVGHVWPSGQTRSERFERYGESCRVRNGTSFDDGAEAVAHVRVQPPPGENYAYPEEQELARRLTANLLANDSYRAALQASHRKRVGVGTATDRNGTALEVYVTVDLC